MVFLGKFSVCFFQGIFISVFLNTQNFIVISLILCHVVYLLSLLFLSLPGPKCPLFKQTVRPGRGYLPSRTRPLVQTCQLATHFPVQNGACLNCYIILHFFEVSVNYIIIWFGASCIACICTTHVWTCTCTSLLCLLINLCKQLLGAVHQFFFT